MTAANWPECFDFTISFEGKTLDRNPKDRGNWTTGVIGHGELLGTKFGIAAHVYPNEDIPNLTLSQASDIYRRDYWPKVAGDMQPDGVDLIAWDICVNSGASRALKIEAAALGSKSTTAKALAIEAGLTERTSLVKSMCAKRAAFYRSLSSFETFGKGWLRRNASAEARGVTMALRATGANPDAIKDRLDEEAKKASTATKANGAATAGSGAGAGGTTQTDTAWSFDWWTAAEIGLLVLLLFGAIYFARKVLQHNERAKAYAAAAKGII